MQVVIPPRDHKPITYRYTWDEYGEVQRVERVGESVDHSSHRQTHRWPFQNNSSPDNLTSSSQRTGARRTTWQPGGLSSGQTSPSTIDKDLIPDYVINYLRGETPETVALRASMKARGPQGVNLEQRDRAHRSRAADFYFSASRSNSDPNGAAQSGGEGGETKRRRESRLVGWRFGAVINALVAFLILLVGVICLALDISRSRLGGESTIYTGDCDGARRINWVLQVIINISIVVLLAISNYVFQVLSSPTRAEVSAAHDERKWLDIGIPSFRNLIYISRLRALLIIIILVTTLSVQILYNGVIFLSRVGSSSSLVFVTESFLSGAPFSNASQTNSAMFSRIDLLSLQDSANRGELTNLTASECVTSFTGPYVGDFSTILIVTNIKSSTGSLLQTGMAGSRGGRFLEAEISEGVRLRRQGVLFCMAESVELGSESCELKLSSSLLGVATLLNLILVIGVGVTTLLRKFKPLATLGDAISSFLETPDATTRNACLLTKSDVRAGRWPLYEAKYWVPREHFWILTPSLIRWVVFTLAWITPVALAAAGLAFSIAEHPNGQLTAFGKPAPHQIYAFPAGTSRVAVSILAGLPHLILALLYTTLNALLSTYFVGHEMSEFAVPDSFKTLRLSGAARGIQKTSLYITLPRPWSWLLILLFSAAGFLVTNSLVVVAVDVLPPPSDLSFTETTQLTALSTSSTALLALLAVLLVILIIPLGLGLRRANPTASYVNGRPAGNPLAMRGGTCSAVISARCHGPGEEGDSLVDPTAERLVWGVVREGEGMEVGRLGFAGERRGPRAVGMISVGRAYA